MRQVVVVENVTLDGVMQAPGRPDEDTRDGFAYGGWAAPYMDQVAASYFGLGLAGESAMLLGRRTYEDFAGFWPHQSDNPFTPVLNAATKYVASRTSPLLAWENSVLLAGDAAASVATLTSSSGPDLTVLGSGELVQSLARAGLVDEYVLSRSKLLAVVKTTSGHRLTCAFNRREPTRTRIGHAALPQRPSGQGAASGRRSALRPDDMNRQGSAASAVVAVGGDAKRRQQKEVGCWGRRTADMRPTLTA
jgi:dihydrofolate reductase